MKIGDKVIKTQLQYKGYMFEVTDVFHNGKSIKIKPLDFKTGAAVMAFFYSNDADYWWNVDHFRPVTPLEEML
jgi:hypothetical protein